MLPKGYRVSVTRDESVLRINTQHITLNVLITKNNRGRGTFGRGEYIYGVDRGDGFTRVYLSPDSSSCLYQIDTILEVDHTSMKWSEK